MATYTIQAADTFSSIAAKLGTTVAAIEQANPGINPSNLQIGQVIQLPQSASTYTIQAGDTFSSIATKFGTSVAALEAANPSVNPNDLPIGTQISIPSGTSSAPAQTPAPTPAPSAGTYIIQAGDTLTSIAAKLGTTVAALESANPGINPNNLQVGAQISTTSTTPSSNPQPTPNPTSTTYIIQAGDTFSSIAAKLGTSVAALESANPSLTPNNLQIGASIVVPSSSVPATTPTTPITTPPASGGTYTIQSGDTFTSIAANLNISLVSLEAANPTVNPNTLQVGQIINLPTGVASTGASTNTGGFVNYSGPASAFPPPSQWATYSALWQQNSSLMSYNDTPTEISLIGSSITTVAQESGIDPRVILCIIMQESGGNVRVGNTNNGVNNTGIMQAFNGVSFDANNPAGSILQMVRDGTEGTASGPGLKQAFVRYGDYYVALRVYNSGSVDLAQLNDPLGATASYVVDIANRLMGHTWPNM